MNKRLKDLVKSAVNPETDEIGALSNSVEEFTSAFVNPLRSDNDTRNTFKSCLDYVVDKAIDAEQKKVLDIVVSAPSYLVRVDIEVVSSCINFLDLFMEVYLDQFAAEKIISQWRWERIFQLLDNNSVNQPQSWTAGVKNYPHFWIYSQLYFFSSIDVLFYFTASVRLTVQSKSS